MKNYSILLMTGSLLAITSACKEEHKEQAQKPNVLFICIDDLRSEIGCYGTQVLSPNLDKLASEGSLFTKHYVQVPTSGASRASMWTGLNPKNPIDIKNEACEVRFATEKESETPETMLHLLRRNGYYTVGMGKITHSATGNTDYTNDNGEKVFGPMLKFSLDELIVNNGTWGEETVLAYADGTTRGDNNYQVKPYECGDVDDLGYPDGLTAKSAVENLEKLAKRGEPFCLAVGFVKPHLPFNAPKKYWDMYERDSIDITDYPNPPKYGMSAHKSGEFGQYKLGDEKLDSDHVATDEYARKLRHAYYAAISYTDAQVGKVLNKLEELGLSDNTIVVVWGDHGWFLGDMKMWGKHSILEPALRSTLIVKAPGAKKGVVNNRVVASTDLYPTLMELCDVEFNNKVDGDSFVKLLHNPDDQTWRDNACSFWGSNISLRTPDYRLAAVKSQEKEISYQLYKIDGRDFERENIASQNQEIVERLKHTIISASKGTVNEIK